MKKLMILVAVAAFMVGCCNNKEQKTEVMKQYTKKYTNADFYKDGKIQPEVCLEAYKDMLAFYGVPFSDNLKDNLWITDFDLGDFENVGMAGIFWVNDSVNKYFGHEIYLLPNQMIPEHMHIATNYPAKYESWKVNHGWCYNFGIGEATPNAPKLPESQKGHITCVNFAKQNIDEVLPLKEIESPHFLFAGDNGAIITEYGTYHDGNGLRFRNPGVQFVDMLTANK